MKTIKELQKDRNYLVYELEHSYEVIDIHTNAMFMVQKEPQSSRTASINEARNDATLLLEKESDTKYKLTSINGSKINDAKQEARKKHGSDDWIY